MAGRVTRNREPGFLLLLLLLLLLLRAALCVGTGVLPRDVREYHNSEKCVAKKLSAFCPVGTTISFRNVQ